jgi:hypothetical protein
LSLAASQRVVTLAQVIDLRALLAGCAIPFDALPDCID